MRTSRTQPDSTRLRTIDMPARPLIAALFVALAGGCVTEVVPLNPANRPAASIKNAPTDAPGPRADTGRTPATPHGSGVPISPGPQAPGLPAAATATTRVAAAVRPLGSIPYDGLTLPLVTPDGRWIITQTGTPPAWETLLAERGARPAPGADLSIIEAAGAALQPVPGAAPGGPVPGLDQPATPAAGLLLGRCAGLFGDGSGTPAAWVLVERPNADGSRWIGRLSIPTGAVEWLVDGPQVNAQALLLRDGTLLYTRRKADQATTELVLRPAPQEGPAQPAPVPAERTVRREGWKLTQPITTPDQTMVAVLAIGADAAELLAFSTTRTDAAGSPLLIARQPVATLDPAAAFQSVASVEACPPPIDTDLRTTFLLVHAERMRLALWDATKGSINLLPAGAVSGVRTSSPAASGLVLASAKGMDFWTSGAVPARLVAGAYVPRSANGPGGTRLLCFAPQAGSADPVMDVVAVELVPPQR